MGPLRESGQEDDAIQVSNELFSRFAVEPPNTEPVYPNPGAIGQEPIETCYFPQ